MSFNSKVYDLLSGITGITDIVGDDIYGFNLPDNFDTTHEAIVHTSRMEEGWNALDGDNVLEIYTLYVVIFGINTETMETLSAAVRAGIDNYSDTYFRDITFQGDIYSPDYEKDRYEKALQYRIIFDNLI